MVTLTITSFFLSSAPVHHLFPELAVRDAYAAAPAAPSLTAEVTESEIELTWAAVTEAVRYELWVWDSVNLWRQIGGDSLTGTSYRHTEVTAGTTYYYAIHAVNAAGEPSNWSEYARATVSAAPNSGPVLSTPSLTAEVTGNGIELSWTEVTDAVGYELWVWDNANPWREIEEENLTGKSYTHTEVAAGTTYYYSIRAVNEAGGTSAWSEYAWATATVMGEQRSEGQAPDPTATATVTSTLTVTSTATDAPSRGGQSQRQLQEPTATPTATSIATATSTAKAKATAKATATSTATATATSTATSMAASTATPTLTPTPEGHPSSPNRPTANMTGYGRAAISWEPVPEDASYDVWLWHYVVFGFLRRWVKLPYDGVDVEIDGYVREDIRIAMNGTSATITNLPYKSQYSFIVRAVNEVGTALSPRVSVANSYSYRTPTATPTQTPTPTPTSTATPTPTPTADG